LANLAGPQRVAHRIADVSAAEEDLALLSEQAEPTGVWAQTHCGGTVNLASAST
jgi:hypothetical protein